MKKILVTGATGFVGSNLIRKLLSKHHQVHILKRNSTNIWRIKDIISKLYVHEVDILDKENLSKLVKKVKPMVIFHLANLGSYGGVDPYIEPSLKINTLGTINLINSCDPIDYDCFINTGSSAEYGIKKKPMQETDLCEPITNYALSKLASTLYAQSYAKRTKKLLVTLRLFSPFGPYDHPARLIPNAIVKMLKGDALFVHNPFEVRDYIFVEDVIDAYLLCMKKAQYLSGEIFNIGSGKQTIIKDVIRLLSAELKSKSMICLNNNPVLNSNATLWQADIEKAKKQLGWYPKKTLIQALKETISWFKKQAYLYD